MLSFDYTRHLDMNVHDDYIKIVYTGPRAKLRDAPDITEYKLIEHGSADYVASKPLLYVKEQRRAYTTVSNCNVLACTNGGNNIEFINCYCVNIFGNRKSGTVRPVVSNCSVLKVNCHSSLTVYLDQVTARSIKILGHGVTVYINPEQLKYFELEHIAANYIRPIIKESYTYDIKQKTTCKHIIYHAYDELEVNKILNSMTEQQQRDLARLILEHFRYNVLDLLDLSYSQFRYDTVLVMVQKIVSLYISVKNIVISENDSEPTINVFTEGNRRMSRFLGPYN